MKKYIMILSMALMVFLLASCNINVISTKEQPKPIVPIEIEPTASVRKLSTDREVSQDYQIASLTLAQKQVLQKFALLWPSVLFNGEKNEIFSPISLYFALAMLDAGASDEEIIAELDQLMGASVEDVMPLMKKVYENNHYSNDRGRCYLANSIWVRPELNIEPQYYTMLSEYFNAESYLANFASNETKKKIVDWINYYTEDLLQLTPENYDIDDGLALMLLNTIYFNNSWLEEFGKPFDKTFYAKDGSYTTKFMYHKVHTTYKFTSSYTAVSDAFANGNRIYYFMPTENGSLTELFNSSFDELTKDLKSSDVKLTVPLFKTMAEYDLINPLKNMGYTKMFDACNGYQGITQNLYIDIIKQNAGIILSEKGVEAAAVTQIGGKVTSVAPPMQEIIITLDHPFFYLILDSNNIPLFMGVTTKPQN